MTTIKDQLKDDIERMAVALYQAGKELNRVMGEPTEWAELKEFPREFFRAQARKALLAYLEGYKPSQDEADNLTSFDTDPMDDLKEANGAKLKALQYLIKGEDV